MKKLFSYILIMIICIFNVSGCSLDSDKGLIVYRNYYEQDVTTFNYVLTNDYHDIIRIANLVDGLVENDKYGNIVPSIADSWSSEIKDGKQIWTFKLKENVYWSNYLGEKYDLVTAEDFVTTLKYSLNYNTGSNNYTLASNLIENASNYYNATLISNYNYNDVISKINELKLNDPNYELKFYENIKNKFEECSLSNLCINNFETVGIKAIDKFTLQFTLEKPSPYFLSALTYYAFLPTNEKFIKEIGFNNFGTSKKTLLYNGAYLLNSYSHSSRIEYVKNQNYWDKDNVFIDKLIFTKSLNYQSVSYSRLAYENGNISEFNLNEYDEVGWKKYVLGTNNLGTEDNPAGNNTYVNNEPSNFTAYYLLLNQNRTNYKFSNLTKQEADIANTAMSNTNFRKALFHGINRNYYYDNDLHSLISTIVPEGFVHTGDKDYYEYFIEYFANKNNISYTLAEQMYKNDPYYDLDKSHYHLNQALGELNLTEKYLPIKIEYTYYYSDEYTTYDIDRIRKWNNELNGCQTDDRNCTYDKIMIVYNNKVDSLADYNIAFYNQEYNLTFLGLYPDFNDPTTYLNSFGSNGELSSYLNHDESLKIDDMLNNINNYYTDDMLDERYSRCAELEYYILYEKNLLLPLSLKGSNKQIIVSNMVPYSKMKASYGLTPFKFKHRKLSTTKYSQEDIAKLKEEYDKGKEEQ